MRTISLETSACRHCRYYTPEGRRGGSCQQLNVPVQGAWKACSLAIPPFAPSWENSKEIMSWSENTLILGDVIPLDCSTINFVEKKEISLCDR
jgi:hypothetical protein